MYFFCYKIHILAWFWGDPHLTTLDGVGYTFNGWGEYNLFEIRTSEARFLLQGRTIPVTNSNATQLVAFAMESNLNYPVEVRMIMYACVQQLEIVFWL